jgi:uncharacterized protein (DUF433 family)
MSMMQVFYPESNLLPSLPPSILSRYHFINRDPQIHGGWPHIKGTRILASDIFRAQIQGHSLEDIRMQFMEMGVKVSKEALMEACSFTLEWMFHLNETSTTKASR